MKRIKLFETYIDKKGKIKEFDFKIGNEDIRTLLDKFLDNNRKILEKRGINIIWFDNSYILSNKRGDFIRLEDLGNEVKASFIYDNKDNNKDKFKDGENIILETEKELFDFIIKIIY